MVNKTGVEMDKDAKLAVLCGNYAGLSQTPAGQRAQLFVQTTETGKTMLDLGRNFHTKMTGSEDFPQYIFTNNDLFFYGLRLAVKDGNIKADDIEFLFYPEGYDRPIVLKIEQDGRFECWPTGFFDAYDEALGAMLD
jgi:hypothetical protein